MWWRRYKAKKRAAVLLPSKYPAIANKSVLFYCPRECDKSTNNARFPFCFKVDKLSCTAPSQSKFGQFDICLSARARPISIV